jgi:hypothetical protein
MRLCRGIGSSIIRRSKCLNHGDHRASYRVTQFHPGYVGFGSSLGGEMFALSIQEGPTHKGYGIHFGPIAPADICAVGATAAYDSVRACRKCARKKRL